MAFGGPTASRGWIRHEGIAAWERAARNWERMNERVNKATRESVELHLLEPMRQAMRNDPSINGQDNETWNMADKVAKATQIFNHNDETWFGVPPDSEAASDAINMEYGTDDQPPSPHFRNALGEDSINRVQTEFVKMVRSD
jgi:hypothetical protein